MPFSLVDEATLSDIPEVSEQDIVASVEGLALPTNNLNVENEGNDTTDNSDKAVSPCCVRYTITPHPAKGKVISFYLNVVNLTSQAVNQFVMLCDTLVTEEDVLIVHLNSILFCDDAETIYNAISDCHARKKVASIPYSLNTAAFYPVLACDMLIPFNLAFHVFDVPSIRAGGDLKDARNAYKFDSERKLAMVVELRDAGFIHEDAFDNIVERQGIYSLYGGDRMKATERFNKR